MPKPRKGEKKADYISRCMGDAEAQRTKPDTDERLGFCYGMWNGAHPPKKKSKAKEEVSTKK